MDTVSVQISIRGEVAPFDEQTIVDTVRELLGVASAEIQIRQFPTSASDTQLWNIVHQRLTEDEETRLQDLMERHKNRLLSDIEEAELATLVDKVNQQMLERSQALVELQDRGYDIKNYLKRPVP